MNKVPSIALLLLHAGCRVIRNPLAQDLASFLAVVAFLVAMACFSEVAAQFVLAARRA